MPGTGSGTPGPPGGGGGGGSGGGGGGGTALRHIHSLRLELTQQVLDPLLLLGRHHRFGCVLLDEFNE